MSSRIGAWLAVWTGLWVVAGGCHATQSVPVAPVTMLVIAPAGGEPPVAVDELARMGRRFVAGIRLLSSTRDRYCGRHRPVYCDQLDLQVAELEAIAEQALVRPLTAGTRGAAAPGRRRVMVISPVVE